MKIKRSISTLARYTVLYLSVLLMACMALCFSMTRRSVQALHTQAWDEMQKRLQIAANEMDDLYASMRQISNHVAADIHYRPIYVERNKYYELERLEDLKRHFQDSSLLSSAYLVYQEEEKVYTAEAIISLERLSQLLGVPSQRLCIKPNGRHTMDVVSSGENQTRMLFLHPIHLSGISGQSGDLTLVFAVDQKRLQERIESISGLRQGDYTLYYDRSPVLGEPMEATQQLFSRTGMFSFHTKESAVTMYSHVQRFLQKTLLLSAVLTVCVLSLGAAAAYTAYYPLKRMAARLHLEDDKDKLASIEKTIFRLEQESTQSRKNLTIRLEEIAAQRRQMRHQLISILLNGVVTPEMPRQMEMAQMYLPYSSYGVLMIPWTVENQGEGPWLEETLQALSGEGVALYGLWRRQLGEYAVLFNGPSEESFNETVDILSDCLENHGLPGTVRRGRLCTELSQLPLSLIKREEGAWEQEQQTVALALANEMLSGAIHRGNCEIALNTLYQLLHQIDQEAAPQAVCRLKRMNLLISLLKMAEGMGVPISDDQMERCLRAADPQLFSRECAVILRVLCQNRQHTQEDQESTQAQEITAYISQHVTDPQLSVNAVADAFGIGARQVGQCVMKCAGMPYKEFVARQKVELAKRLLVDEDKSVDEASAYVCYASAAYFIKVFKEVTGCTPGQYKRMILGKAERLP